MALTSGATHVLQWPLQRAAEPRGEANPKKSGLSSDWSLQLDSMKLELLVIAHQHGAVNTFPGLVHTARQAMEAGSTRNRCANPQGEQASKVRLVTGAKS